MSAIVYKLDEEVFDRWLEIDCQTLGHVRVGWYTGTWGTKVEEGVFTVEDGRQFAVKRSGFIGGRWSVDLLPPPPVLTE